MMHLVPVVDEIFKIFLNWFVIFTSASESNRFLGEGWDTNFVGWCSNRLPGERIRRWTLILVLNGREAFQ